MFVLATIKDTVKVRVVDICMEVPAGRLLQSNLHGLQCDDTNNTRQGSRLI